MCYVDGEFFVIVAPLSWTTWLLFVDSAHYCPMTIQKVLAQHDEQAAVVLGARRGVLPTLQ